MEAFLNMLHDVLNDMANIAILLFEFMGVGVLIFSGIQGMVNYIRRDPLTRLKLAKGMAMGLEFKLGSEILRTVIVREFSEILLVAGIVALRAILTFLIHWEIKNEEKDNGDIREEIEAPSWPWTKRRAKKAVSTPSAPEEK